MDVRARLAEHYPMFGLEVRTPRLTLRYPDDEDAVALAELGAGGVHAPNSRPFTTPWTSVDPPHQERNTLDFLWTSRGQSQIDEWNLPLAAVVDGEVVGAQGIMGRSWAVTRTFETGSWLGLAHHGRGIGKEMRTAVLHLGFAGFGAEAATTSAFADNPASLGVTRALGYRTNGHDRLDRGGESVLLERYEMHRSDWERSRRADIEIVGADEVAALFGTVRPPAFPEPDDA